MMATSLASEESLSSVIEIRPLPQRKARDKARREALAHFRQMVPVFIARLPPR